MANELTITVQANLINGNLRKPFQPAQFNVDQTTANAAGGPQTIGTTEEQLGQGDVSTLGWLFLTNTDTTNYVQIGFSAGTYGIRIAAGQTMAIPLEPGATIYCKANTAACIVDYLITEA